MDGSQFSVPAPVARRPWDALAILGFDCAGRRASLLWSFRRCYAECRGLQLREELRGHVEEVAPDLSWKVRYRTFPWFFSQTSKLYRARSLLYRRQILQVNIRWKALDEIYKINMLLHRSDLSISENFRQNFSYFLAKICKNSLFLNSFQWFLLRFWWNFVGISPII